MIFKLKSVSGNMKPISIDIKTMDDLKSLIDFGYRNYNTNVNELIITFSDDEDHQTIQYYDDYYE